MCAGGELVSAFISRYLSVTRRRMQIAHTHTLTRFRQLLDLCMSETLFDSDGAGCDNETLIVVVLKDIKGVEVSNDVEESLCQ